MIEILRCISELVILLLVGSVNPLILYNTKVNTDMFALAIITNVILLFTACFIYQKYPICTEESIQKIFSITKSNLYPLALIVKIASFLKICFTIVIFTMLFLYRFKEDEIYKNVAFWLSLCNSAFLIVSVYPLMVLETIRRLVKQREENDTLI